MTIQISVVIPTYNRSKHLHLCLNALNTQTMNVDQYEVIVVDDGSSDDTPLILQQTEANSRIHFHHYRQLNQGPAKARNLGIQKSNGDLIAFTDDDCIPSSNWLSDLFSAFPNDIRCAGIGGLIVRQRDTLISRYIDCRGTMVHPTRKGEVIYLVTGNALYRRSCLIEVGGFDIRICWPGGEDPDLSLRLRERGYYFLVTQALIKHQHRDTVLGVYKTAFNRGRGNYALSAFGHQDVGMNREWRKRLKDGMKDIAGFIKRESPVWHECLAFLLLRCVELFGVQFGYNSRPPLDN